MSPTADRRLIVTGDDFGLSPAVNAGIVQAYRDGILTGASLMVNAPATEEAVALAHENPGLAVGLHLVLAQGRPSAPCASIPDLVGSNGRFGDSPVVSGLRYFLLPGIRTQLRREIEAQLRKFQVFNLGLAHVDGHLNLHLHPEVLDILLELAWEYRIRAIRLTREPLVQALMFDLRAPLRKLWEASVFCALARWAEPRLRDAGIHYVDVVHGLHQTGAVDEAYVVQVLEGLRPGSAELYCHPGTAPEGQPGRELAALCSRYVRDRVYQHGITLSNYWQLGGEPDA